MEWHTLFAAPPPIAAHALMALSAFAIGAAQLALLKGTLRHRIMGYGWVLLMASVAFSSFAIRTLNPGALSFVHIVSAYVLIGLPFAVLHARRHNVRRHAWSMIGLFIGGLIIAGGFTLVPGRIMHRVVFGALLPRLGTVCG